MSTPLHVLRSLLWLIGAVVFRVYGAIAVLRNSPPRPPLTGGSSLRILVIRLDLLGDVVFSIPTIDVLGAALPKARIDALVLPYTAPILRRVPAVATIHELDINRYRRPRGWLAAADLLRTIRSLRAQRYDIAIGLSGLMGGVFAALSGARWRIGYELETYRGCYNLPIMGRRYSRHQHEVEYCLDLVRALGVPAAAGVHPRLPSTVSRLGETPPPPQPSPVEGERDIRPLTPPYAVLVPGASNGAAKRWPPSYWGQLGDRLAEDLGLNLVIVGAPSERALAQAVVDRLSTVADNLAGSTSLENLMDLLARAAVVVAGDTGPLHVAAALGTAVVGIYGPTDPANTGPLGERSEIVRLGVICSPCYDLRTPADCKLPDRSTICMAELQPKLVFDAVARVLDGRRAATRLVENG